MTDRVYLATAPDSGIVIVVGGDDLGRNVLDVVYGRYHSDNYTPAEGKITIDLP